MTEKEEIEFDLKCLRNVMNNFEDRLCEKMQEKVDNIKNYIEQKDKEIQELKADRVEKDKIIKLMAKFMNKRSWKEHQLKDDDCYCCKIEYSSKECVDCIIGYFQKKAREENERNKM